MLTNSHVWLQLEEIGALSCTKTEKNVALIVYVFRLFFKTLYISIEVYILAKVEFTAEISAIISSHRFAFGLLYEGHGLYS